MDMSKLMKKFGILLLAAAIAGCGDNPETADGDAVQDAAHALPVSAYMVTKQQAYEVDRQFAGLITSGQSSVLGFEFPGKLSDIVVDEGQVVSAGQILATQDTSMIKTELEQLAAQLEDVKAQIQLNDSNSERISDLRQKGFAAEQRADELSSEAKRLAANRAETKARIENLRLRLDKAELRAPYAGRISARQVDEGVVVDAGAPVFSIQQSGGMEARVGVPVRLVKEITVGAPLPVSFAGDTVQATVLSAGNDVTASTLTVPVRLALPADVPAVAGDQAYLTLHERVEGEGFWVPLNAITEGIRGLWQVYVLEQDDDAKQKIVARDVSIAYADGQLAYVNGALADGEWLLANGLHRVVPGQKVVISQRVALR